MDFAIRWFWNNIFIIGIIVIESILCAARPRRRGAVLIWACFTAALLAASSLLTHTWQWEGDLIRRDNLLTNTLWRMLMVYFSALQLWLCYDIDVRNALFVTQVAAACQTAQFSVYMLIEVALLGFQTQRAPGLPSVGINLFILILAAVLIYWLFGRGNRLAFRPDNRIRYVILLAAVLHLSDMLLNGLLYTTDPNANFGTTMLAMRGYSLLFNFVTLYMLYNLIIRRKIEKDQDMLRSVMRLRESQYHFSKELVNSINIKSHDLKKQIHYQKTGGCRDAVFLDEVENLANAYDATIHTENAALSTVLTEKSLLCLEKQIPFSYSGDGGGLDFMRGIDIYTLFANLLDNAMEASLQLEPPMRSIQLVVKRQFGFISIHCANRFSGRLIEHDGTLHTLKPNADEHGFGYRSMEEIVARYDGSITHRAEDGSFVVNILLPLPEK